MKFDSKTNSNTQNSMVVYTLSVLGYKYPFWATFLGEFGPKNQNCQFELKIGTKTNANMKNSMVMVIFSVFDPKYPLFGNFFRNSKLFVESVI